MEDGWPACLKETESSAEGELVGGFEGRSAGTADDGGAVAADQRVIDGASADGAPEANRLGGGRGWWRRWRDSGHSRTSVAPADGGSDETVADNSKGTCRILFGREKRPRFSLFAAVYYALKGRAAGGLGRVESNEREDRQWRQQAWIG